MIVDPIAASLPADARALFQDTVAAFAATWQPQHDKPDETPTSTIAALWHSAGGTPLSARRAMVLLSPLDAAGAERLRDGVARRSRGEPLAYIVGRQHFMELELLVSDGALIPREETELLGRAALTRLHDIVDRRGSATVIDVCSGCGNLAIALAWHEPRARIWGADLSEDAVTLARENVAHIAHERGELGLQVEFRVGDLLAPFAGSDFHGQVDLLVCNPPYISSGRVDTLSEEIAEHEPRMAFDGGPLGIRILQRLINDAPLYLRKGGCLAFEVGLGQGRGMKQRLEQCGYENVREIANADGNTRALLATTTAAQREPQRVHDR